MLGCMNVGDAGLNAGRQRAGGHLAHLCCPHLVTNAANVDGRTRQKLVHAFWPMHPRSDKLLSARNWCDVSMVLPPYAPPCVPQDANYGGLRFVLRAEDAKHRCVWCVCVWWWWWWWGVPLHGWSGNVGRKEGVSEVSTASTCCSIAGGATLRRRTPSSRRARPHRRRRTVNGWWRMQHLVSPMINNASVMEKKNMIAYRDAHAYGSLLVMPAARQQAAEVRCPAAAL